MVEERAWLMNSQYFYFKICLKDQSKTEILLALKHEKTCSRWIRNFKIAGEMVDFWSVMKPIAPKDQIVEMLNDETNEIKLHKRKTR